MSNECCKISPEDQALLDAGEYTPEELFGVGGKPSCPLCTPMKSVWPKRVIETRGLDFQSMHLNTPEVTCRGSVALGTACRKCSKCVEEMRSLRQQGCPDKTADLDLERRALKACGYRVHEKERNGTRWLMACKGLQVQYKHWHPLTSIHQAMQLLIDAPYGRLTIDYCFVEFTATRGGPTWREDAGNKPTAQDLINAQCRAIVTACASLEPVR